MEVQVVSHSQKIKKFLIVHIFYDFSTEKKKCIFGFSSIFFFKYSKADPKSVSVDIIKWR